MKELGPMGGHALGTPPRSANVKHDKNQANGLTMTKEIGPLDTQTLDVLLGLTEKAVIHQLLKSRHMWIHHCMCEKAAKNMYPDLDRSVHVSDHD